MKQLIKKLLGIDELEAQLSEARNAAHEAQYAAQMERARVKKLEEQAANKSKSEKDIATENKEPYVNIVSVEIDPSNPGQGAFELDWNEFFVAKLVRAGYEGKDDEQIVDQWFQDVCRNVVLETYEQYAANNPNRVNKRDLGNGRVEIS